MPAPRRLSSSPSPQEIMQWVREAAGVINEIALYRYLGPSTIVASSPYTVGPTDVVLLVNTGGARTINLPALASWQGRPLYIKDAAGAGAAVNNITIDGNGAETIDGAATLVIGVTRASVTLYAGSLTNWSVL